MVQQMEEGEVREDTPPDLEDALVRKAIVKFVNGRKCYALARNKDGKFHVGSTQAKFASRGKMYTAGITQALQWFSQGLSHLSSDFGHEPGDEPRDMSEYTVVEYSAIEVARTPADEWMEAHGKKAK